MIRGAHSLNMGYEYNNRTTMAGTALAIPAGPLALTASTPDDGFADYLLGLLPNSSRNYPIQTFGMANSPYSGVVRSGLLESLSKPNNKHGPRWDYWHNELPSEETLAALISQAGKAVAGEDKNGKVDLTAQPVAPFLAAATKGQWVPASQIGAPAGLFEGNGYFSPRFGIAWRPRGSTDLVVRAGYGIFTSSFAGNRTASSIVAPPYWTFESTAWSAAHCSVGRPLGRTTLKLL